jgi:hypothetical protein
MFHPMPKYSIEELLAVYWKLREQESSADAKTAEKISECRGEVDCEAKSATCRGSNRD